MQLTFLSKTVRTIGLITILGAIEGISLVQTAQAQSNEPGVACSAAYFADRDYMYNPSGKEKAAVDRFNGNPARIKRWNDIWAEVNTFSVTLDAPVGYTAKIVNGKPVPISRLLAKEMYDAAANANRNPNAMRRRVAELNRKYARYATFGQQITLIASPEQVKETSKWVREINAYSASVMTPEQKQREQDSITKTFNGSCPLIQNIERMNTIVLEVGKRPDLDKRLRADKTGATFFK